MRAVDASGQPTYSCGEDGSAMLPVEGSDGILYCPKCGLRTDESGTGMLGDGFDVVHRQWGLRGDPHVWQALRSALAKDPTPDTAEAIRAAYARGLHRIANIDIDADSREPVYREEFAHGGMSSGMLDIGWWHDKGVPLLTERALARRPKTSQSPTSKPSTPRQLRSLAATVLVWLLVLAIPAMTIGGGSWLLYQRAVGTKVEAKVLACGSSVHWARYAPRISESCVAEWTIDGRTVVGGFNGGNGESDVGKTVTATVRGDTAYSRSLGLPILLILLGLPFLAILLLPVLRKHRRR